MEIRFPTVEADHGTSMPLHHAENCLARPWRRWAGAFVLATGIAGALTDEAEARLSVTDKLSTYRRATSEERIDLATRLAKSFSPLSPRLDRDYFVRCLEETVNIGDPRDLELDAAVRLCVAAVPE